MSRRGCAGGSAASSSTPSCRCRPRSRRPTRAARPSWITPRSPPGRWPTPNSSRRSSPMAERKTGAGPRLSGVLERSTPPSPPAHGDPDEFDPPPPPAPGDGEPPASTRGRGTSSKKARRIRGRTIHLHDDLFERILVQAHRRDQTISEYVTWVLHRQV